MGFFKGFTRSESWTATIRLLCLTVKKSNTKSNVDCNTEVNYSTEEHLHQVVLGFSVKHDTKKTPKTPNHAKGLGLYPFYLPVNDTVNNTTCKKINLFLLIQRQLSLRIQQFYALILQNDYFG